MGERRFFRQRQYQVKSLGGEKVHCDFAQKGAEATAECMQKTVVIKRVWDGEQKKIVQDLHIYIKILAINLIN